MHEQTGLELEWWLWETAPRGEGGAAIGLGPWLPRFWSLAEANSHDSPEVLFTDISNKYLQNPCRVGMGLTKDSIQRAFSLRLEVVNHSKPHWPVSGSKDRSSSSLRKEEERVRGAVPRHEGRLGHCHGVALDREQGRGGAGLKWRWLACGFGFLWGFAVRCWRWRTGRLPGKETGSPVC